MVTTRSQFLNGLKWLLTVFLISSFEIFDSYSWGKYLFLICSVLIFIVSVIERGWIAKFRIEPFIVFVFIFVAYVAVTAVWSINSQDTLTMARTLLRIGVCFTLVYWAYMDEDDPYRLITVIVFASYIVALYSTFFYGFGNILRAANDIRLANTYSNVNGIALLLAMGCICDLFLILFRGFKFYSLLSMLSVVIILATQSRKAALYLGLGIIALVVFRFSTSKKVGYKILKVIFILLCSLLVLYFVLKLPIFSGVNNRMDAMIDTLFEDVESDSSTVKRSDMISLGLSCWRQRPINGVGMAATHILTERYLYYDTYLHNNYVELLAGGGIIGFIVYYSMCVYLIAKIFQLRKTHYQWYVIGIVLLGLLLIMDYGRVSYYSKTNLFELMILFLIVSHFHKSESAERKEIENDRYAD